MSCYYFSILEMLQYLDLFTITKSFAYNKKYQLFYLLFPYVRINSYKKKEMEYIGNILSNAAKRFT